MHFFLSGLVPTILRGFLYSGFRIGMYPTIRGIINDRFEVPAAKGPTGGSTRDSPRGGDSLFVTKLIAGGLCGAAGSFIFSPLDLVRIKFQRDPSAYPSTGSAFRSIFSEGGLKGLWQGSSATVARATMLSACQLSIYDQIKSLATSVRDSGSRTGERGERGDSWYTSWLEEGPLLHAAASLLSGVVAQGVIMPVDVIKTKMMATVSGSGSSSASSGRPIHHSRVALTMMGARALIWREGGIGGFYRGFVPALMRQGPCILIQVQRGCSYSPDLACLLVSILQHTVRAV